MTTRMFPHTTQNAKAHEERWSLVRLDLARNIHADIADIVFSLQHSSWRRARKHPILFGPGGMLFRASGAQLLVYDKRDERLVKGKHAELLEWSESPVLGRIEVRYSNPRTLQHVERYLASGRFLPLLVKQADGTRERKTFRFRHRSFHRAFRAEIRSLSHTKELPDREWKSARDVGLTAMAEYPDAYPIHKVKACPKTLRLYRRIITEHRLARQGIDLLKLCYPEVGE